MYSRVVFRGPDDREAKELVNPLKHRSNSAVYYRKWSPDISADERNRKKKEREDEYVQQFEPETRPILLVKKKQVLKNEGKVLKTEQGEDYYKVSSVSRPIDDILEELPIHQKGTKRETQVQGGKGQAGGPGWLCKFEGVEFLPRGFLELDPLLMRDEYEFESRFHEKLFDEEQKMSKELRRKQYSMKNFQKVRDVTILISDENRKKVAEFLRKWYAKYRRPINDSEIEREAEALGVSPDDLRKLQIIFLRQQKYGSSSLISSRNPNDREKGDSIHPAQHHPIDGQQISDSRTDKLTDTSKSSGKHTMKRSVSQGPWDPSDVGRYVDLEVNSILRNVKLAAPGPGQGHSSDNATVHPCDIAVLETEETARGISGPMYSPPPNEPRATKVEIGTRKIFGVEDQKANTDLRKSEEIKRMRISEEGTGNTRPSRKEDGDLRPSGVAKDSRQSGGAINSPRSSGLTGGSRPSAKVTADLRPSNGMTRNSRPSGGAVDNIRSSSGVARDSRKSSGVVKDSRKSSEAAKDSRKSSEVVKISRKSSGVAKDLRPSGKVDESIRLSSKLSGGPRPSEKVEGIRSSSKVAENHWPSGKIDEDSRESERVTGDFPRYIGIDEDCRKTGRMTGDFSESRDTIETPRSSSKVTEEFRHSGRMNGDLRQSFKATEDPRQSEKTEGHRQSDRMEVPRQSDRTGGYRQSDRIEGPRQSDRIEIHRQSDRTEATRPSGEANRSGVSERSDEDSRLYDRTSEETDRMTFAGQESSRVSQPKQSLHPSFSSGQDTKTESDQIEHKISKFNRNSIDVKQKLPSFSTTPEPASFGDDELTRPVPLEQLASLESPGPSPPPGEFERLSRLAQPLLPSSNKESSPPSSRTKASLLDPSHSLSGPLRSQELQRSLDPLENSKPSYTEVDIEESNVSRGVADFSIQKNQSFGNLAHTAGSYEAPPQVKTPSQVFQSKKVFEDSGSEGSESSQRVSKLLPPVETHLSRAQPHPEVMQSRRPVPSVAFPYSPAPKQPPSPPAKHASSPPPKVDDKFREMVVDIFHQEIAKIDGPIPRPNNHSSLLDEFHHFCAKTLPSDARYKESILFVSMFYYFMEKHGKVPR